MNQLLESIAEIFDEEPVQFCSLNTTKVWTVSKPGRRCIATVNGQTVFISR